MLTIHINNGVNPIGINPDNFKVSWYLDSEKTNARQTEYEISFFEGKTEKQIYTSGVISGGDMSRYFTSGILKNCHSYTVKVSVILSNNEKICGTLPFTTQTTFSNAKWICGDVLHDVTSYFTKFKKELSICKKVTSAVLYTSFHTYGKLWVNGNLITGLVTPAPSNIEFSKYYLSYDITDFLKKGDNSFESIIYYINEDGQNFIKGIAGFLCEAHIYYEDGTKDVLASNEDWLTTNDTHYSNNTPFQQNRKMSTVTEYDFGHKTATWKNVQISEIENEKWGLKPQFIPEGAVYEVINPLPTDLQNIGVQVFDTGKIVSGWVRVCINSKNAQNITIRYSEDLDENGRVRHNVANESSENYLDRFITVPNQNCVFEADFTYKAFRYFEIIGADFIIDTNCINVISAGTKLNTIGEFSCSNPLLCDIYSACIQTQINNTLNALTDCPHREQSQYVADSNLQLDTLLYNFDGYPLALKVLDDFSFAQYPDGTFPFVYPSNNKDLIIPEWDLYYLEVMKKAYDYHRDISVIEKYFSTAERVITHALDKIGEDGLVLCDDNWHIDDWPYPKTTKEKLKCRSVENFLVYNDLKLLSFFAEKINLHEKSALYIQIADKLKTAIIDKLYNAESLSFTDGLGTASISQAVNVAALYYDITPRKDRNEILNRIANEPLECSVVMTNRLLHLLFSNGYDGRAYQILSSPDYPGWGNMILSGYKTVWEGFDNKESHSHAWNAYPARMFQQYICGINTDRINDNILSVSPKVLLPLNFAKTTAVTPKGVVLVDWEKKDNKVYLKVKAPAGIKVNIKLSGNKTKYKYSENKNGNLITLVGNL